MTISFMRMSDRFLGIPLCWLAGLVRKCFSRSTVPCKISRIQSILVIKFFGMGSIILTTPALGLLRRSYPQATITYLSFASNRDLLERYPSMFRVLAIDTSSFGSFLRDTMRVVRHLLTVRHDVVFDFEFFSKFSTLLTTISSASWRIGFSLPAQWRTMHLTHHVELNKEQHVSRAFCEQVFCIIGNCDVPNILSPNLTDDDMHSLSSKISLPDLPLIAVNVNAGTAFLERRWKPERFAALVSALAEESDWMFYFIGSGEERTYVEHVIGQTRCSDRCRNIAGMLNVPELAVFLRRCKVLISNDSGPLHLASAVGTGVVGLYGPETPRFYAPMNAHGSTIYKSIECSPCMNMYAAKSFKCPYHARCMDEITVEEVKRVVLHQYALH